MGKGNKYKHIFEDEDKARYGRRLRVDGLDQKESGCGCSILASVTIIVLAIVALWNDWASFKTIAIITGILLAIALIIGFVSWAMGTEKIERGKTDEWIEDGDITDDYDR